MKDKILSHINIVAALMVVVTFSVLKPAILNAQTTAWVAPPEASEIQNSLEVSERVLAAGKNIYAQLCAVCHGNKGAGDGVTAAALQPKPADFTTAAFQEQTDGEIYYKVTEGRPPMPGFKTQLSEQQAWAIVHYLRTFSPEPSN
jgi:mono/diheme cytochrome c family protein